MSFDPTLLNSKDAAFIEPRVIFDPAILHIEDKGDYKKLYYSRERLVELMSQHYPNKAFSRIEHVIQDAEDLIELA